MADLDAPDDPMQESIRSDEANRQHDEGGEPEPAGSDQPNDGEAPDPTDAPDLAGTALSRLSRFGLTGSITMIVVAVCAVLLAVLSPNSVSHVLGRGIGGLLVVGVLVAMGLEARFGSVGVRSLSAAVGVLIVGGMLAVDPDRWLTPIGWAIGAPAIVFGLGRIVRGGRPSNRDESSVVSGVGLLVGGLVACFALEAVFEVFAVTLALLAVASGVVGVAVRSGYAEVAPLGARRRPILIRWIDAKSRPDEGRDSINDVVFFEGRDASARLARFMLVMIFASVISAAGVLADSTAVVIGAMLVAPLINPMMGMGLSLVTGWPNRLARSTVVVLIGTVIAVGAGVLLASVTDVAIDLETNTQIVSRSSPRLIDLVIAVAAGAAGAYALSRREVSSALPGVAVAIALVPPLSVVGVTAYGGDWRQASGTLLLFLTNLVAIILAGGAVFLLTGVVPLRRFAENQRRVRTSLGAIAALAVVVVGGLVLNGRQIAADAFDVDQARAVVDQWLGDDTAFTVTSVVVTDGDVAVVLTGPGDPPSADRLVGDLADRLGSAVQLDLQWIPRRRMVVSSG
ncbi:MAG: DUF389 domain-containing protein [Ilumatobacteraceae bacterium]